MKVSIVIATYRRDTALKTALLSAAQQTHPDTEIILVDDNADPLWNSKVQAIVQEFPGLHYVQNDTNKGSGESRNIGIREAIGAYVTFLDDDDVYLPNKVANQLRHMEERRSDYSVTDLWLYSERDKLLEKRVRQYIHSSEPKDLMQYHLMYHITGTDSMMFRRDYLISIGGFAAVNVGDEFYLMMRAIEAGGVFSYMPGCDVKAYVHTEQDGLSSGEGKIQGENSLYDYKKAYFEFLDKKARRYIRMRHYAVLAFVEIRRKSYVPFFCNGCKAFFSAPIACSQFLLQMR